MVLRQVDRGVPADQAARALWQARGPEVSAGNGSVMYCAPLGIAYSGRPDLLSDLAPRLSSLTHVDERCRTAVLAVTLGVALLVGGRTPIEAVRTALDTVLGREGGEELEFLVDAAGGERPIDGPDKGFCLFAAAVGLQACIQTVEAGFEPTLRRVVSLGGDTDTNGAVAGALAGAVVGLPGLPRRWLERLIARDDVEREAAALVPLARSSGAPSPAGQRLDPSTSEP